MKPVLLAPLALLLGAAGGAAVTLFAREPRTAAASGPAAEPELAQALEALRARIEELARENAELARALERASLEPARAPVEDIEALVARVLERRAASAAAASDAAPAATSSPTDDVPFDAQAALAELLDPELDEDEQQALWHRYAKAGHLDQLVALFEERAAARADDPDAQVDLGGAYLQKVFESGGGPLAGQWAMKADQSFDAALALDERHWEARFSKAVSLSFWPPAMGKQGEAIKHFETLVSQQEQGAVEDHHVHAYLMLGNTYQQIGDAEKALATWKKGASLFPDHPGLAQQIANAGGY